jgi:AraC-like DNA-binding protein
MPTAKLMNTGGAMPLARVASLLRYMEYLRDAGVAVDHLLDYAGIPEELLAYAGAAVPLESAFRFIGLACRALGTEHLGLYVGQGFALRNLGAYERRLRNARTVHAYLSEGVAFYNRLVTGQRLWISVHGTEVRVNAKAPRTGIAPYQSHLETMVATIAKLREAAGPGWVPAEIDFAYPAREPMPAADLIGDARVLHGCGHSYMTIPRALLAQPIRGENAKIASGGDASTQQAVASADDPLPEDFAGIVRLQLGHLMGDRTFGIDAVAESLGMSKRSLQRRLAGEGLTYSGVLADVRLDTAARWLRETDKSVGEIAFRLGDTDAANFTRAFRGNTGISPRVFRENSYARTA